MTKSLYLLVVRFVLFSAVISGWYAQAAEAAREIILFTPAFAGPKALGQSVSTILALQVFSTLRKTTGGEEGVVNWGPKPLPKLNHLNAEAAARRADVGRIAQIVLWGTVDKFGDGALVQAFLSVPEYKRTLTGGLYEDMRRTHKEIWTVRIAVNGGVWEVRQDIPRRRLHFEPIVLKRGLIEPYSKPEALPLYNKDNPQEEIGKVGPTWKARISERDRMLVISQGIEGIVKLPELSENRNDVVDYASGLVRIFRGDWAGAEGYFYRVAKNLNAPTDVRIDAYLYQVFVNAMLGRSGAKHLESARALNPYANRTVRYAIMDRLTQLSRALDRHTGQQEVDKIVSTIRQLVSDNRHMFPEKDLWLDDVISSLKKFGRN